jgi:thiamine pyrophosphate-dependent acetolactate synthase large subunit-like protein/nitrite reductase/ring-hydroxylating ferredoxin subunit
MTKATQQKNKEWIKVLKEKSDLPEGRVMTVEVNNKAVCLSHFKGKFCALDNKCPHQGGPLGEGSIENGFLRCPWHGWDYEPCTGLPPGGYDDGVKTFEVKTEGNAVFVEAEAAEKPFTTISDIVAQTMVNWKVNTVFGIVGHSNLGLADALRIQEAKGNLQFIDVRHEGAGAFAASAYGKLTGKPAACFGIAGPGATNMYTGMWDAKVDRAPLLVLTGQVATQVIGTQNFQEVDLINAFDPVAGFNHRMEANSLHGELTTRAIKYAILQNNVSHLTFPDEIQEMKVPKTDEAGSPKGRLANRAISPPDASLKSAIGRIKKSKRPVIIVGHGARFHMPSVTKLAEMLNAPVLTTFKGKGLISDHHPLGCGVLGRSGTPVASWFMNECDLLIVFGASFSKHTGITPKKPTIQIDHDPEMLAKFDPVDYQLYGDIEVTANKLSEALNGLTNTTDQRPEIATRWKIWRTEKKRRLLDSDKNGVSSIAVFDTLTKLASKNAIMCVDVGNNAYSFGRYFETINQQFLMSGYLGSIGFAMPAAMGAWASVKDKQQIIAVAGDGGFAQYLAEVTTIVKYKMPIKLIIMNNNELGKISKEQRAGEFDVWKTKELNPSFADFAISCGAKGLYATKNDELEAKMTELLNHNGPALLEIKTNVNLI